MLLEDRRSFFATAEKLSGKGVWRERPNLIVEIPNSGDYFPATEEQVQRIAGGVELHA